jgi:hypothetical protein
MSNLSRWLVPAFVASTGVLSAAAPDMVWQPVTQAELQMKAPTVDKDAGVEALFWRVHVMDEVLGQEFQRVLYHYVRLKIFNEDGKEKASTLDIEYPDQSAIDYIAGRTIKPDGTIVELSKDAIHERVVAKASGVKIRARSFAMPGVEVGAIVEYRWKEIRDRSGLRPFRLQFQREFPVEKVTYFIKPIPREEMESYGINAQMAVRPFNCRPSAITQDKEGYNVTSLENVPAFQEEPMMPGEPNVRPWLLVTYRTDGGKRDPDKYWAGVGKASYGDLKQSLKTNGDLKRNAAEAVSGAKDDNEKVVRLIQYIRANVRDLYGHDVSDEDRAKVLKKRPKDRGATAAEIFKSGMGSADELNILFAALAMEIGLDARPALIANRDDLVFNKGLTEAFFLRSIDMAVMIDGKWKIYDVSARMLPPEMLGWREEGVLALVADPKDPDFVLSPVSPPDDSLSSRTAKLTLAADGTLEGDVEEKWTGHAAFDRRYDLRDESESSQLEQEKDAIVKLYPRAEVSDLHLDNIPKPEQPLDLRYHIRIPGYAGRTGKRILFQPLFFERSDAPVFTSADRRYDVVFPYAWRESDDVSIALPAGFELEKAESPGDLPIGGVGAYALHMSVADGRTLSCKRDLTFGNGGNIYYQVKLYPALKNVFDEVSRRDAVTLSLLQASTRAAQ